MSARFWGVFIALLGTILGAQAAAAQTASPRERLRDVPCIGCLAAWPPGTGPVPLLVLLHGDGQSPAELFAKWEPSASRRAVAVLALACPEAQGCKGSWWRWDGQTAWIEQQVRRLSARRPIDPDRLWLAGWSGGASYAGRHSQALEKTFAALVLHGGGIEPAYGSCAPTPSSVYFLVGDRNPLHPLALALRRHYDACGQPVHWALLHGADHESEWTALNDKSLAAILDWLATVQRSTSATDAATEGPAPEPRLGR